jgi:hypothetical protein
VVGVWIAALRILDLVLRIEYKTGNTAYQVDDIQGDRDAASLAARRWLV